MDRVPIQMPSRSVAEVQTDTHVASSREYDEGSESRQAHVDWHEHLRFVHA